MSFFRSRVRVLFLFAILIAGLGLARATLAPAAAAPPTPRANWSPCFRDVGPTFECATVQVPEDHDGPGNGAISISMVRLPATDPDQRIGSLFINPGGPGGSGVNIVLGAGAFLYTPEVRAKFDLVGFDPRGIYRSTALRCFGNPKQWGPALTPFAFPLTPEQEAQQAAADMYLASNCDQRNDRMLDHMSTADVARDLDLLRQAVGDEKLTYVGYSYGSYLGVTYANLFPDNFRALVVDGVLDPIAWSTGAPGQEDLPFSTRLRSDAGAQATLEEFFRLCDTGACPFGPDSQDRYAALADQLRDAPILVQFPDGSSLLLTYPDLIGITLSVMYDPFSWPLLANFLTLAELQAPPVELGLSLQSLWEAVGLIAKRGFPQYQNALEGFPGVACADSDNPSSYDDWSAAAADAEANFGYFGPIWTWASSPCAVWPGSQADRYIGPFDAQTGQPVLVTSTLYDPATRYEGAVTVADLLPNSTLLTVAGWGHTTIFLSQCADEYIADYLIDGTTPPADTVCPPNFVPFQVAGLNSTGASAGAENRARVNAIFMPDVLRDTVP